MMKIAALFIVLALATACSREQSVPTSEENRQLDDAANLLDQAPANLESVDDSGLGEADRTEVANTP